MPNIVSRLPPKVVELAELVNASLKDVIREYSGNQVLPSNRLSLGGWCGVGTYVYNYLAKEEGITTSMWAGEYKGNPHCWNIITIDNNSYIVDVTASQFKLPDVNITVAYAPGCGYNAEECIKKLSDFDTWWDHEQPKPFLRRAVFSAVRRRQRRDVFKTE